MNDPVRAQYEALPYPPRDPRDEAKRLVTGSPSHLLEIDHYLFAGRLDFARPFRALIAGGGTGDAAIMLAQQLADRGCPAEIVYLDISEAARAVAEARAAARGLANLRFVTGSLLALPTLAPGAFDYIDCCGVLHHLEDPAAGLARLAGALAPEGGIGLMVYGALGRTGVYHLQAMLRTLAPAESLPAGERIRIARALLRRLPPTNWFARNPAVGDHVNAGDAGLFDLLLHARDRAYTVPEVAALAAAAGLEVVAFIEPWRYDPACHLADPMLLRRLEGLPPIERAAFAELLTGNLKSHVCYLAPAGRAASAVARLEGPEAVPVLREGDGPLLARRLPPGAGLTLRADGLEARFPLPRRAGPILARIDGRRSLAEIRADLAAAGDALDWPAFRAAFEPVYRVFNGINRLFLRYPRRAGDGRAAL